MTYPENDPKELEDFKRRNREERLKFIDDYALWLKRTPNGTWSAQHKKVVDQRPKKRST